MITTCTADKTNIPGMVWCRFCNRYHFSTTTCNNWDGKIYGFPQVYLNYISKYK